MRSILVVDDEANLRHTLAYALRQEGYEVLTAEDGEAAIRIAANTVHHAAATPSYIELPVLPEGK